MSRAPRQKQKLLLLRQYLEQNTDEEHPASTAELIAWLDGQGVSAERKSIYDDMETLRDFGLDVVKIRRGNQSGWYLGERPFQLAELRLLVDAIQSSRFLTKKKSLELIGKLEHLTSKEQARGLRRQLWVKNRIKSMNESIYYLVDELHAAIVGDRRISFHYFTYNPRGQRELRRGGARYRVSPWALLWDNENYYLVAFDASSASIRHFRVDKMLSVQDDGPGREGRELFQAMDMSAYTNAHFGMFSGETTLVRMEFKSSLAGAVIDRFGSDAMLVPGENGCFTLSANVAVNEPFFAWLCTFGGDVRLLGPESAVEAMRAHIEKIRARYEPIKEESE